MKLFSLFLLTLFLGKSCSNEAQNDLNNAVIQYAADTRGFHLKIIISNQIATVSQGRSTENPAEQLKISNADWNELVALFQKVELNQLPELKDPTQKRHYDGAAIASLKVRYQNQNYETKDFDHGFPPEAIEKIVQKIVAFAPAKE